MTKVIVQSHDFGLFTISESGVQGVVPGVILIDPGTGTPSGLVGGLATPFVLLNAETGVVTGPDVLIPGKGPRAYSILLEGTGALTATVYVDVSVDGITWISARYTFSLSGTTSVIDWFTPSEAWPHVRGRIGARTGTGAAVTLKVAA